jgi:predicted metalloprotease with PDZ domain
VLQKSSNRPLLAALTVILQIVCNCGAAGAEDSEPIFDLDCISFAGRFLANAPVKKKVYQGLAVDGTAWSIDPASKKVTVTKVFPGEAAEKAGIEVGDEIVKVNGYATDGLPLGELFYAYHMYEPDSLIETLVVKKKDGSEKTHKLQLLTLDKCNGEEKTAWLDLYKSWGY